MRGFKMVFKNVTASDDFSDGADTTTDTTVMGELRQLTNREAISAGLETSKDLVMAKVRGSSTLVDATRDWTVVVTRDGVDATYEILEINRGEFRNMYIEFTLGRDL